MTPITKAEIEELDALEKKAVASWNVENGRGEKFKCTTMDTVIFQEALVKIWPRIKALAQSALVPTEKELYDAGWIRRGGPILRYQGGDNVAPTGVEYYNPQTGHAVIEFVGVQPRLLEKGKEEQYEKRFLYWGALSAPAHGEKERWDCWLPFVPEFAKRPAPEAFDAAIDAELHKVREGK